MLALLLAVPLALDPTAGAPAHFALKGTVLDPSRAPVAAARVVAVSIDQRLTPSTQTDGRGEFELLLAPGTYSVRVTAAGFLQGEQSVTALETGSDSREFVLKLAPFGETVTVKRGSRIRGGGHLERHQDARLACSTYRRRSRSRARSSSGTSSC